MASWLSPVAYWDSPELEAIRHGSFHVVSVMSTTGFTTDPFYTWPSFVPLLLISLLSLVVAPVVLLVPEFWHA